jgi:alpha-L-fucosidase
MAEYQKFAGQFDANKFDAAQFVSTAKNAGMKYIVITAKHHDGFAMFKTKANGWNILNATPFKKDPLKALAKECRKQGIKLGFYYSQAQDWNNGGSAAGGKWDKAQEHSMDDYIDKTAIPQVTEILSNYGPDTPAVVWWDTPIDMNKERASKIDAVIQKLRPGLIQNNRLGGGIKGDTETPEQHIPPQGYPGRDWETCMTLNDTWGFKKDDQNWKPLQTIIRNLCDIASKGGNYLLNVGPDSHGEIPTESVKRLADVGSWMKVNGDAIYGTTSTPFGEELGKETLSEDGYGKKRPTSSGTVWRATQKPGHVYLIIFQWPDNGTFTVPTVKEKLTGARLLADSSAKLTLTQDDKGTIISGLPAKAPDYIASVIDLKY